MPSSIRPGDVLGERYLLEDLLSESGNGRFWRAHDSILERHVAVHVVAADDEHAEAMMAAARSSAVVPDRRILRVLDVDRRGDLCWVVNEWGSGTSLDRLVGTEGPLPARRAAWMVSEVADVLATAHEKGVAHGRLVPENVLVDRAGEMRVIGFSVDAALLGLPPGRVSSDVVDLAGLLYYLLTGRWPGVSRSAVPDAPLEAGRVLRPRQVKAGIPRVLDALCDQVLNPYVDPGKVVPSAAELRDELTAFVGDPTGMAEAEAGRHDTGETIALSLPPLPDPPLREQPEPEPEPEPEPTVAIEPPPSEGEPPTSPPPGRPELPTQAGMPIFDDATDDVSWLDARRDPPPPPPPFEEPPERPLFAPAPPDGAPPRKPRPTPVPHTGARDYWPWDTSSSTTGSGVIPAARDEDEEDEVPGRRWLRLAFVVGLCAVLLLGVVFAFNLGRGRSPLGGVPDPEPSSSPTPSPTVEARPVDGVTARDLDPQTDGSENPESVGLAVDGDAATAWNTSTYDDQLGPPPGLKTGVGLVLDLGRTHEVAGVDLTLVGQPTRVSLYVADRDPTGVAGLTPALRHEAGTRASLDLESPTTGRYVIVWLTRLPAVSDGFRGEVAEVVVRGVPGGAAR